MSGNLFSCISNVMESSIRFSRHFSISNQTRTSNLVANINLADYPFGQLLDKIPDIKTLKKLHSKILLDPRICSSIALGVKLMRAYAARGQCSITRKIFEKIPERNVSVFNVMIRSYANNQMYKDAILMFRSMVEFGIKPDHYSFPCVLKACSGSGNLRVGLQVHGMIMRNGLDTNLFVGNGLVAMYGKCGCLVEARCVLDEIPRKDVVSWNSMVAGYSYNGMFDKALEVCRKIEFNGMKPNDGTMASLLPSVSNTTIENVEFVKDMFINMEGKDLVSWNVMIAVYVKNSMTNEAVKLYLEMEARGFQPDVITIASILPACGDLSHVLLGKRIHYYVQMNDLLPNLSVENALIDMYAKCGCLDEARKVFDMMRLRDVISWTSMISAYGASGQGHNAVELFNEMESSGLVPDSIAFVSVLSACSHAGLLKEGKLCYKIMTEKYEIVPRPEHFACMVDLLGRAGQIDEAYSFIKEMHVVPTERVWGALLSACRVHNNMDIGLVAADRLFQLAPKQSGYYVLISNIFAKAGRWKEVTTVRLLMKDRGVKKMPGISNVELKNQVYTFLAGDRSHPESNKIYEELDVLVGKMKEAGYVPETDSALHDVEEEDKETHLAVHSEKLAIVFAIINTEPGTPIRITKNLRVCGDCHIAAKLISKITDRAITLRDTNRFHNFQNGICSCGDYW